MVTFGNSTNNRLENANRRIKLCTHPRNGPLTTVQKIRAHTMRLLNEYTLAATVGSDRIINVAADDRMRSVLNRLTTYAAKQVWRHFQGREPNLPSEEIGQHQVRSVRTDIFAVTSFGWVAPFPGGHGTGIM